MKKNRLPPQPKALDEQLAVIEALIVELRHAHTSRQGVDKGAIADPAARQKIDCLEATRRVLLWADRCHQFTHMGNHLLPSQRTELKGLEAAVMEAASETGSALAAAMTALLDRERAYGVHDEGVARPRWQD